MQNGVEEYRVWLNSLALHLAQKQDRCLEVSGARKAFDEDGEADEIGPCILARHIPKQLHGSLEISCTNQCIYQGVVRDGGESQCTLGLFVELHGSGQLLGRSRSLDSQREGHSSSWEASKECPRFLENAQSRLDVGGRQASINHAHEGILRQLRVVIKQPPPETPGLGQVPRMPVGAHQHHAGMRRGCQSRRFPASQTFR
mmetsp:Transcript_35427/g.82659  ORF Transcript_35427/g.82659 Transcript_35427/m.82659 type:complete len:201 (+) Transcript_35427:693-1295(+)